MRGLVTGGGGFIGDHLSRALSAAGNRVVQISALGADGEARSRYHLTKRAADDHLSTLPLHWTILRPSTVFGPGAKSGVFFRALAALPWWRFRRAASSRFSRRTSGIWWRQCSFA